jgi:Flp pilus assembly protein TadD
VTPPPDPLERNAPLRRIALAVLLVTAAFLAFFHITNLDLGGHLTVGREILVNRAIPDTEFFSHTSTGHPYPVHQWLGEVTLFVVDHFLGVRGLILLRMVLVVLGAWLLYRNARREGAPIVVAVGIVLMLLVACRTRFFVRPFLVTLVFLPLLSSWLADLRDGRTRRLWPIPVLLTVWAHIHSGVLFGVLFLLAAFVGEGFKILWARRGGRTPVPGAHLWPGAPLDGWNYRRLVGFGAAGIVLPFVSMAMINPSGLKPLILPFLIFRNDAFRQMIAEYRPVDLSVDWPFNLVAGAVLLGIALRPKRVDVTQLLLSVGFGALAFQAVRGILPFAVASAPLLGRTWGALAEDLFARVARGRGKPSARAARANAAEATSILLLLIASLILVVQVARGWQYPFGFGKDPKHYPERALDFLWSQNVRGPIFNTDLWASSLLWRGKGKQFPVFVDARLEAYPPEFWKDSYYRVLEAVPGWEDVLARYDVRSAILRREGGQVDDRIGNVLWDHPDWGLVYWNDVVMIYVKRHADSLRNDEVLGGWEFTSFNPRRPQDVQDLQGVAALEQADVELTRLVEWEGEAQSFLLRWTRAEVWMAQGRGEEAAAEMLALSPRREARDNVPFRRSRAQAELAAGRREVWAELLRTIDEDPTSPDVLFRAAAFLARAGLNAQSAAVYRDVVASRPDDVDAMNNLALVLARSGDTDAARRWIEEALRRQPDDPYYVATLAEVRFHAGDREGALEGFHAALDGLAEDDAAAREEVMRWILRLE